MTNGTTPKQNRTAARLFGLFFILSFLSYGIGTGLIDQLAGGPDFSANIINNKPDIVLGAVLMAVVHTVLNIGLPVLMWPILRPFSQRLTVGYLSLAITATTILAIGAIFSLLLVPLSEQIGGTSSLNTDTDEVIGLLLRSGGQISYHLGMAIWAVGGVLFCAVLYKSKLLPRFMPIWGIFGYLALIAGSVMELFRHNTIVEIASVVPGGLFEITLSLWLIFFGFRALGPLETMR